MKAVIVSYLNTLPLRLALDKFQFPGFSLETLPPSDCYRALKEGWADLGLAPVVILNDMQGLSRIGNIGICSKTYVKSVGVFSNAPTSSLKKIFLDNESRTSVLLLKWLCRHVWKQEISFQPLSELSALHSLKPDEGVLLIGDKALRASARFAHYTDLVQSWQKSTGLPFVFAAWIGKKEILPEGFEEAFTGIQQEWIRHPDRILEHKECREAGVELAKEYLMHCIS
ncbi:MAG: hypothetical protein N3F09_06850, partial [Bacteroidia bacterium]|nr:hypothetical protein [Bacteroidia bacterium]